MADVREPLVAHELLRQRGDQLLDADDPGATIAGVEELVAVLPQELVRYERFPNVGHGVFRDRPETMTLVREFLLESAAEPA